MNTKIFKYAVLSLYVIIPVFAFMLGMRYQEHVYRKTLSPPLQQIVSPTIPAKQQPPPYGKVTIQGTVDLYDLTPATIDGAPTLHVLEKNGMLFDILLPAGESSCPFVPERNDVMGKLKKGDAVEIYGTAATADRVIVCDADEYVKIISTTQANTTINPTQQDSGFQSSFGEEKNYVINSQAEWNSVWNSETNEENIPDIDFSKYTVLLAAYGVKSTGGYSITIEKIEEKNGTTYASVQKKLPGSNCQVSESLTQPYHWVAVKKLRTPVIFNTITTVSDC